MAITPKKRFTVLQRDWFQCKYCGKKAVAIQLEVDHVISKAEWGWDELDNLVTSCTICNIGKGKDRISETNPNLWKIKITDIRDKLRKEFTNRWNDRNLWKIDNKTFILLCTHIKHYTKDPLSIYMNYWDECDAINSGYEESLERKKVDTETNFKLFECKFKEWGEYCDMHLSFLYEVILWYESYPWSLYDILERVCKDDWTRWDEKLEEEYSHKLNYCITDSLLDYPEYSFLLQKYTLHPHLLTK